MLEHPRTMFKVFLEALDFMQVDEEVCFSQFFWYFSKKLIPPSSGQYSGHCWIQRACGQAQWIRIQTPLLLSLWLGICWETWRTSQSYWFFGILQMLHPALLIANLARHGFRSAKSLLKTVTGTRLKKNNWQRSWWAMEGRFGNVLDGGRVTGGCWGCV